MPKLWLALGLAAVTLGAVAFIGYRPRPEPAPVDPRACIGTGSVSEREACFEPYLQQAVGAGNTAGALDKLEDMFVSGSIDDCHMLAHQLGHITYAARGNLSQAMRAGDARCAGGYHHGVVEAAMHGGHPGQHKHEEIDVAQACSEFKGDSETYDGCVHGLGHGAMQRHGHNVTQALQECERLRPGYEQRRCRGGVFMQNSMQHLGLDDEQYRQTAPRSCNGLGVKGDLLELCYEQIGEVAMFYYRHNLSRAGDICHAVEDKKGREACEDGAREEQRLVVSKRKHG